MAISDFKREHSLFSLSPSVLAINTCMDSCLILKSYCITSVAVDSSSSSIYGKVNLEIVCDKFEERKGKMSQELILKETANSKELLKALYEKLD